MFSFHYQEPHIHCLFIEVDIYKAVEEETRAQKSILANIYIRKYDIIFVPSYR